MIIKNKKLGKYVDSIKSSAKEHIGNLKKSMKKMPSVKNIVAKKNMNKENLVIIGGIIIILVVLFLIFNLDNLMSPGATSSGTIVTVNGEEITAEDVDQRYEFFFFLTGYPDQYREMIPKESFVNQLIDETLLLQQANKEGITISNAELEQGTTELIVSTSLSESELKKQLENKGFSMDYLRGYYKNQMTLTKLLNQTILKDLDVSDAEIKAYYDKNKEQYSAKEGQIRASHILVKSEKEAEEILEELFAGANFAEMAKRYSTGPSGVNGGELGFFGVGQMIKEFEETAFALKVNEISEPVQTNFGWHIIQRKPNTIYLSEAQDSIKEILITEKQKELIDDYVEALKAEADIIINDAPITGNIVNPITGNIVKDGEDCSSNYGLTEDTIIFYHADWCPYCQDMVIIVRELEQEGYNFHWAESSSGDGVDVVVECFKDSLQGGVPEFICAKDGSYKMGAMSKSNLKKFADECKE